ncbi:response regulator [Ekhidna sp.]
MEPLKRKVLVVDDHAMFLDGLVEIIGKFEEFEVVGRAQSAVQALDILKEQQSDIVISDVRMSEMGGYELTKAIREEYPHMKILIVSMHNDPHIINQLLKAGVTGYILKNTGKEELLEALRSIASGKTFFSNEVKSSFIQSQVVGNPHYQLSLTKREKEVLQLIAEEYTTNEMAERLFISLNTVESHRKNILRKLDVRNSVGIVKRAISLGLLD